MKSASINAGGKIGDLHRVAFAASLGSLAEYFDWGVAAFISALVWPSIFFPELSPAEALAASLATFGSVYLIRPVGAYVFGRFGDLRGRRAGLMWTLVAMGTGSLGLAFAPGYATAGILAPVFLLSMRVLQGFGHGGEWGGASTWVAELATPKRRAFWTGWVTFAAPAGNLLASMSFFFLSLYMPRSEFFSYGWRILFFTGALVAVAGLIIRWKFVESPLFEGQRSEQAESPRGQGLPRLQWRKVILLTFSFACLNLVVGVLTSTYGLSYLTTLGVTATGATFFAWIARVPGIVAFISGALISDLKGRVFTLRIGILALLPVTLLFFPLVDINTFAAILTAFILVEVPVDFASGGVAALFTESFPTRHRNKGAGMSYHTGALITGVFLSLVIPAMLASYGSVTTSALPVSLVLMVVVALSLVATLRVRETLGASLLDAPQSVAPSGIDRAATPPDEKTVASRNA